MATRSSSPPGGPDPTGTKRQQLVKCFRNFFGPGQGEEEEEQQDTAPATALTAWIVWSLLYVGVPAALVIVLTPGVVLCLPPMTAAQCEADGVTSGTSALTQCTRIAGYNGGRWHASAIVVHALLFLVVWVAVVLPLQRAFTA